ncbi:ABC transporter permease [Acetobacterium bakii]|uniref:Transport permease protein n=1 Tax=Acetobacterium bakii TaxID=52689 RepID=A0A0L6U0F3_9FIRM|nr:ABC transporter permease [Acetobacterium bakii]KNZ41300.1 ABC transporter [Acetobacterium bakii]
MNTVFNLSLRSAAREPFLLFWSIIMPIAGTIGLGMLIHQPGYALQITTGMMATGILFYAFTTTVFSVLAQRKRGVYKLLRVTPMPLWRYILSVSGAWILVSLLCAGLVLAVGSIVFDFRLSILSVLMMGMVCVLGAGGYVFLSFFISGLCKSEAQASIATNLITLPFLLCSSAFYSLESAPQWVQLISAFNPFQWFVNGLRTGFLMDVTGWLASIGVLLLILLITLFLAVKSFGFSEA